MPESARILNVDDDQAGRAYKSTVLREAGFTVDEAATGLDALTRIHEWSPDAVLLDVQLPGIDGLEVCRRVRQDPRTDGIPILQISAACVTEDDWMRGLDAGADGYLFAPVAPEILVGTLRQLLYRRSRELTLQRNREHVLSALETSERRYRDLFFHAPYGIYTVTAAGRILSANQALALMLRADSIEALTACNPETFFADPTLCARLLDDWRVRGSSDRHEVPWQRCDGRPLTVRLTGRRIDADDPNTTVFEVFVEDVTDQRRLEAESRQAQKMEAVGRLAAGIAHDFNNLLTAILGYTELMLEQIETGTTVHADLSQVHRAATSAAGLTQQLLAFGRKQVLRLEPLDVNTLVRTSTALVGRMLREDIRVSINLGADVTAVRADRVQLEQVLLNLAVNARDAMPHGGTLTIETAHVEIIDERPFPWPVRVVPGRYMRLTVADTGCGMDAETQRHLFEPFFTTKGPGRGTGLGLATVYGIVKQLGGYIWVSSELNAGSTFNLYFPAITAPVVGTAAATSSTDVAVGRETIMVIEDEPAVRALAVSVLGRHGYRVVEAALPSDALHQASAHPSIDLILSDVVMPEMNGPALVGRLHAQWRRRVPVVYMSGYAGSDLMTTVFDDHAAFLAKPFTQTALLQTVRDVLDGVPREGASPIERRDVTV